MAAPSGRSRLMGLGCVSLVLVAVMRTVLSQAPSQPAETPRPQQQQPAGVPQQQQQQQPPAAAAPAGPRCLGGASDSGSPGAGGIKGDKGVRYHGVILSGTVADHLEAVGWPTTACKPTSAGDQLRTADWGMRMLLEVAQRYGVQAGPAGLQAFSHQQLSRLQELLRPEGQRPRLCAAGEAAVWLAAAVLELRPDSEVWHGSLSASSDVVPKIAQRSFHGRYRFTHAPATGCAISLVANSSAPNPEARLVLAVCDGGPDCTDGIAARRPQPQGEARPAAEWPPHTEDGRSPSVKDLSWWYARQRRLWYPGGPGMDEHQDAFDTVERRVDLVTEFSRPQYISMTPAERAMTNWGWRSGGLGQHYYDQVKTRLPFAVLRKYKGLRQVCELGFNVGHSAVLWLEGAPDAKVISFDLGEATVRGVTLPTMKMLRTVYGERFSYVLGDSLKTIPKYIEKHPDFRCDVILVDGSKDGEDRHKDLINFQKVAHADTVLILDEVAQSNCAMGEVPQDSWECSGCPACTGPSDQEVVAAKAAVPQLPIAFKIKEQRNTGYSQHQAFSTRSKGAKHRMAALATSDYCWHWMETCYQLFWKDEHGQATRDCSNVLGASPLMTHGAHPCIWDGTTKMYNNVSRSGLLNIYHCADPFPGDAVCAARYGPAARLRGAAPAAPA
eukprot:TRINITY_DN1830_c1_g2_i1.p1 TRINITY_DN1830_c1_g2~~TRINITY_DN1830_c1_g2_i1.p1  ORF type:complete len:669 (+),score=195.02 TRINITY_DN1830_c1_g2_i1:144-2150(+)